MAATATKTLTVKLMHRSSISGARWCQPIGWEPKNEIEGADFVDGSWWSDSEEEAGLVCFASGDEGDEIEVDADQLRVATTGDCRVVGTVEI